MHTDWWIGDADTHYSNNWRTMEKTTNKLGDYGRFE
jgi:hypothetical protein